MNIVHGTFHLESQTFRLWGEADSLGARKPGRRPKTPRHPFAVSADQLKDWTNNLAPYAQPEIESFTLWLPGSEQQPQASLEMRTMGVFSDDASPLAGMRFWQVEGIVLTVPDTVDLLVALAHRDDTGRSLQFWRAAVLEALALVIQQQVIPALEKDGFRYRAFWKALPEQPERLTELAAQMPPLCRSLAETPAVAPAPYNLLETFVGTVVDATIREAAAHLPPPSTRGPGGAWLSALTTADPMLKLPTAEAETLFQTWQTWVGQHDAAGNSAFRIAFRLGAPEDEANPNWRLDYLLQANDDPSLIVSASQIWSGQGARYLQERFDEPQERLLRGLAFAGRLFTPILDSLRSVAPASSTFDTGQAYTFLQEAAPLLQASGFRVLLPRWWGGKKAKLTARAQVSGGKQSGKSRLTLDTLVRYEYQVLLGEQPIDRAEFMRLAQLKQPLVRLRGQWVLLDAAQIEAGLKFFEQASGELSLNEVLRLGLDGAETNGAIPVEKVRADGWLKTLLDTLQKPEKIKTLAPPEDLQAELRPYQQRGFSWLAFLRRYGLGACLADDMGLGKTITTIALLLHTRKGKRASQPALVVYV